MNGHWLCHVLDGENAGRLHNDFGQVINVALRQHFTLRVGQSKFALGLVESSVDGLESDARLVRIVTGTDIQKICEFLSD